MTAVGVAADGEEHVANVGARRVVGRQVLPVLQRGWWREVVMVVVAAVQVEAVVVAQPPTWRLARAICVQSHDTV